jgi:uncharacterized protein (TIGR02444 family)
MSIAETGALVLDSALWKYALVFYAREGVSDACLLLQDEGGVDIVELIFALYAGEVLGLSIDRAMLLEARAALGTWRQDAILPLRHLRRRLKAPRTDCPDGPKEELRSQVKQAELRAEQIQLALLERWVRSWVDTGDGHKTGVAPVVELVLSLSDAVHSARLSGAVDIIVAAAAACDGLASDKAGVEPGPRSR